MSTSDHTSPDDDADLLARFRAGDHAALEALMTFYNPMLLAFLKSRCRNAEDVCNDVWIKVMHAREKFRAGNFRAWLFRIAKNHLIDLSGKLSPQLGYEGFDLASRDEDIPDDRADAFEACWKELGEDCQRTLWGMYVDEVGTAKLAEELKVKPGTISSRTSRCSEELAGCVNRRLGRQ